MKNGLFVAKWNSERNENEEAESDKNDDQENGFEMKRIRCKR